MTSGNVPPSPLEPEVIRLAVVDDHPIARHGIEHILGATPDIMVVSATDSVAALLDQLTTLLPDVVVLDLYLNDDMPSLDAVSQLSSCSKVLVVSASGRATDVLGAVRAGARGYLTKQADPEQVVNAVETVAAGGFFLSSELADIIQSELATGGDARPAVRPELSPREEETLRYIAEGFTHAQTATRMGIRKATVETYVERIRTKLQVGNKAELTRAAIQRLGRREGDPRS